MKAIRIHRYGGPEVLQLDEVPVPVPAADELLVRVKAAGVNPVDWKIREGWLADVLQHRLPLTLGWDVAGVVESVGASVSGFKAGDAVYARPDASRDGCYADYVVVRASEAAIMPPTITFDEAAGVPLAALTAWKALFDEAGLKAGQRVLIHAGAGGVGGFGIQLAKHAGAHVIATASTDNLALLRLLGADVVVDYTRENFIVRAPDVDVVFDTIGGDTQDRSWACLNPGGVLVSVVSEPDPETAQQHRARGALVVVQPNGARLAELAKLIDAGVVTVVIDDVYPLSEAREAHEHSQTGHARGKIVLHVSD
ncbi:NADP-dependent oxidoreductase [Jeongeupia naejangsanensis]|uniref:NADP-dependent oxidoreductase n=1 Tax=Jeongeupia naejangsanensis TaxID=613195 RepID=A0ABS2BIC5_9NEIS|nr:NADP-dependent oxidoreductase [Jeongeupia naejangsanensis]MBM3115368.1 NADP-dependent oxidoreductase [Jeongeupia naejangsanensis]